MTEVLFARLDEITTLNLQTPNGTGALTRTALVRTNPSGVVDITDFALRDGSVQTTGIANALTLWKSGPGNTLIVQPGTYKGVWPSLSASAGNSIIGNGWPTLFSTSATAFSFVSPGPNGCIDQRVKGIVFAGDPTTTNTVGVRVDYMHSIVFEDVQLRNTNPIADGFYFTHTNAPKLNRVKVSITTGLTPVTTLPTSGIIFGTPGDASTAITAGTIQDNYISWVSNVGIYLAVAVDTTLLNNVIESAAKGIFISSLTSNTTIIGGDLEGNTASDIEDNGFGSTFVGVDASSPIANGGVLIGATAISSSALGGRFYNINVNASAKYTTLLGVRYINTFTNSSANTIFLNVVKSDGSLAQPNTIPALTTTILTLKGATSGSTILQPNAVASGTLTLPVATDTLIAKATTDTLTNKTYDTAGAGNSFLINGLAVTANAGTGAVVRALDPIFTGGVLTSSPTTGVGYTTGAGGAVTQLTSRTTAVTLNKISGDITMFSAAGNNGAWTQFTVNNSTIGVTDTVTLSLRSSTNIYSMAPPTVAAGSFLINIISITGTSVDAPIIHFNVVKGVNA